MKRSTKITSIIIIFFLIITTVIVGRTMIGNHFKKKFSKRPPPGIIVTAAKERIFENIISTYGTATPFQSQSFKIEKYEILKPIKFNQKVKKGEIVGTLGQSGRATGPHLDIRLNWFDVKLDPASILN